MESRQEVALIIGAGPAGLMAAYQLLTKTKIKPIIIEANKIVGGNARTIHYHGNHFDLSGHYFKCENEEIRNIFADILPLQGALSSDDRLLNHSIPLNESGPDPEVNDRVTLLRHRNERILAKQQLFDWPVTLNRNNRKRMGFKQTNKSFYSYIGQKFNKQSEIDLESYFKNRYGSHLYESFYRPMLVKLFALPQANLKFYDDIINFNGLQLRQQISQSFKDAFSNKQELNERKVQETEFYYPKLGTGQMFETLASRIITLGGEIILNARVNKIYLERLHIDGIAYLDQAGKTNRLKADYYFSSIPLKDFFDLIGETRLNREAYYVANNLAYRKSVKIGLLVNDLAIKNDTKIPSIADRLPDTTIYFTDEIKMARLQIYNNWSPYLLNDPQQTIWLGLDYFIDEDDQLWSLNDKKIVQFALEELEQVGLLGDYKLLDQIVVKTEKAYPVYNDNYNDIELVRKYLNQVDNFFPIGSGGRHRLIGLEKNMASAIKAVQIIINPRENPKNVIWE